MSTASEVASRRKQLLGEIRGHLEEKFKQAGTEEIDRVMEGFKEMKRITPQVGGTKCQGYPAGGEPARCVALSRDLSVQGETIDLLF